MARKNIFDILEEKMDMEHEIGKIEELLIDSEIDYYSLEEYVDKFCLFEWKARGRCISCDDIRKRLAITRKQLIIKSNDQDTVLKYLEYIVNLIWLCNTKYVDEDTNLNVKYQYLQENVYGLIQDLGYDTKVLEEEEKVLLLQKNEAAIAVAEITPTNLSNKIIEYNHFRLKGDLESKREILLALADNFEPKRKELEKVNATLESNIGYLLNKMNIRHNNKAGKGASSYVSNISDEELEQWYDETYQMLLLAELELDNMERNKKVNELKKRIEKDA